MDEICKLIAFITLSICTIFIYLLLILMMIDMRVVRKMKMMVEVKPSRKRKNTIEYGISTECKNKSLCVICCKCEKCGRKFKDGLMVDDGGTEFYNWSEEE